MEEHLVDFIIFIVFVVLALLRLLKSGLDRLSNAGEPSAPGREPKRNSTTAGGDAYGQPANDWQYNRPAQSPPKPPTRSAKPRPVTEIPDYHTASAKRSESASKTFAKVEQPPRPPRPRQTQFAGDGGEVQRGMQGQPRTGRAFSGEMPRFTEPAGRKRRPEILLDLKNKRKLRLAMITREVIDRPRAFDI